MDGVQEKQGPHALVEVVAAMAEGFQTVAFGQQFRQRGGLAKGIQRTVAHRRIVGCDNANQLSGHAYPLAVAQFPLRQQFQQQRQHLLPVDAVQRQGDLRGQQAIFDAHIVAPRMLLRPQIFFTFRQFRQRIGQM